MRFVSRQCSPFFQVMIKFVTDLVMSNQVPQHCDQCDAAFEEEESSPFDPFYRRQVHRIDIHGAKYWDGTNPLPDA